MCLDNIFWIPSSPEYPNFKKMKWIRKTTGNPFVFVEEKYYVSKLDYIFRYRIWSVIKDWRDIIPGVISSFVLTLLIRLIF
jgi:hypothetical protein